MIAPRQTPKLKGHPLSAVRDCLINAFAATLRIWRPSRTTRHSAATLQALFFLSLAPQPSLGLGLLHKIRLNFLEASEQFSFYRVGLLALRPTPIPEGTQSVIMLVKSKMMRWCGWQKHDTHLRCFSAKFLKADSVCRKAYLFSPV
jgi:hypothetical protein